MKRGPWSIARIVNWRRYLIQLAGTVPLAFAYVGLDALLGIGHQPWPYYGVLLVYSTAGMWWCTR